MKGLHALFFVINSNPSVIPALAHLTETHKGRGNAARKNVATLLIAHVSSMLSDIVSIALPDADYRTPLITQKLFHRSLGREIAGPPPDRTPWHFFSKHSPFGTCRPHLVLFADRHVL